MASQVPPRALPGPFQGTGTCEVVKGSGSGPHTSDIEHRPASSQLCDLECITCLIFKNRRALKFK